MCICECACGEEETTKKFCEFNDKINKNGQIILFCNSWSRIETRVFNWVDCYRKYRTFAIEITIVDMILLLKCQNHYRIVTVYVPS